MSFSGEQKAAIAAVFIKSVCCRRAHMQGILAARAELEGERLRISTDSAASAEYIATLAEGLYSVKPEISTSEKGGRCRIVSFTSQSASRFVLSFLNGEVGIPSKCKQCAAAFLRGAFFAAGRIADPEKQYSLEFSLKGATERFMQLFSELGLVPRLSVKKNERVVYFKKSEQLEDFFALAGMNQTAFALMDAKIQRELRNNANRVSNCELNNIDRAVSSSMHRIELLSELERRGLFSQLPDELAETARLRMKHSDLSLSQLAALITPHISKSGLSHRLKKITELAVAILSGNLGNT
ncbi:MAG: DNA-binding protein WhiA [Clostridia bacterium]|nr:DNA-binding protein WhiA [Clostridia bacterium]